MVGLFLWGCPQSGYQVAVVIFLGLLIKHQCLRGWEADRAFFAFGQWLVVWELKCS